MLLLVLATAVASTTLISATPRVSRQALGDADEFQTLPRRAVVEPGGSVTFLVKTGTPLQRCHFYLPGPHGRFMDFSSGARSASNDQYEYYGGGLESGECGIRIKRADDEDDGIVECKARAEGSFKWQRCVSTLRVTDVPTSELPVFDIVPRTATLTRGDNITITCNADRSLTMCHIYLPGPRLLNFDRGAASGSTHEYRYHGNGLEAGHCGAVLTGVDERLTGYVVCKLGHWPESVTGAWETDALKVTTNRKALVPSSSVAPPVEHTTNTLPNRGGDSPDESPQTPPGEKSCAPLTSSTMVIVCSFAGETTECGERQPIGTTARLDCKPGHSKPPTVSYKRVVCKRSGEWDRPLFACTAECGRRKTNKGATLISGGQDVEIGEFPWHIGLYESEGDGYAQKCGGSLITPKLVVTAAHCFWHGPTNRVKDKSLYKLVAGKHLRAWEEPNPRIQIRDAENIIVPTLFRGHNTNFASDIALVYVATPFELTGSVGLICFDWDSAFERRQLTVGNEGVVTGWGYTEDGDLSPVLRYVQLPYVPPTTCLDGLSPDLQPKLTQDKLCAGYVNQSISVCRGDSGGGLVFQNPETSQYYLRGVVSIAFTPAGTKERCYSQLYTGFTSLSKHQDWIQENL